MLRDCWFGGGGEGEKRDVSNSSRGTFFCSSTPWVLPHYVTDHLAVSLAMSLPCLASCSRIALEYVRNIQLKINGDEKLDLSSLLGKACGGVKGSKITQ